MTYTFGGWFGRYWAIASALKATRGNFQQAAARLGIYRTFLYVTLRALR